jgi:hypothetical protein
VSSRPLKKPHPVIVNGDMTTTITSEVSIISNISMIGYSYSWIGAAPVGNISVQISNDYSQNEDGSVRNAGTWTTIYFSVNGATANSAPVAGSPGSGFIDIDTMSSYAIRTVYTPTSGSGSLQALINLKVQ